MVYFTSMVLNLYLMKFDETQYLKLNVKFFPDKYDEIFSGEEVVF